MNDTPKMNGIRNIYIIDFLMRMATKQNFPVLIYLAVNVVIIGTIFTAFFSLPWSWGMISGLILYTASVIIALSPIGEGLIRFQTRCSKITDPEIIRRIEPLFREVFERAHNENSYISEDVRLFIIDDDCPNAFATGRRTICMTKGLLSRSDEEIKATFAHEFGHLAHKDTDRLLVVFVGNLIITIVFTIVLFITKILGFIFSAGSLFSKRPILNFLASVIITTLTILIIKGLQKLWTTFGILLCMKTSRNNEYQADEFAFHLGYGQYLCSLLGSFHDSKPSGLFASLYSSHPENSKRIQKLHELEMKY